MKEQFAHVPEQLRLKKIEFNRAEAPVHRSIEFIAERHRRWSMGAPKPRSR